MKNKVQKGQMFLIASILLIIGLIMLKNLLGIYSTVEETRYQETKILGKQLNNVMNEYKYTVAIASAQQNVMNSLVNYTENLSTFLRTDIDSEILYAVVMANSTTQKYYITLGNYLKDKINATINVTNSTPSNSVIGILEDKTENTTEFQSEINGTINITITYTKQDIEFTEIFPIVVSSTNNLIQGFFDIKVKDEDIFIRMKDIYNYTW